MRHQFPFALLLTAACATPPITAEAPKPVDARYVARQAAMAQMADNFERVHFEFDSALITNTSQDALFLNVNLMRQFPEIALEVEGHCDEVGSVEYNLALGQRRANAIRRYMVQGGVDVARIRTISYGEEVPLDGAHADAKSVTNRRAEFRLSVSSHSNVNGTVAAVDFEPEIIALNP